MVEKRLERWKADALRLGGEALVEKITEISDVQTQMMILLDKMDDRQFDADAAIQRIFMAFPGSDVEGHRRYHDAVIERTAEIRSLRIAIQEKVISALVWSGIVFCAWLAWTALKMKVLQLIGKA